MYEGVRGGSTKDLVQMKRKRGCTNVFAVFMIDVLKNLKSVWEELMIGGREIKCRTEKREAKKINRYHTMDRDIGD